jgi:hypothetical protein
MKKQFNTQIEKKQICIIFPHSRAGCHPQFSCSFFFKKKEQKSYKKIENYLL